MKRFCVVSPHGEVLRTGSCHDDLIYMQEGIGETSIEIDSCQEMPTNHYYNDSEFVEFPPCPSPNHIFDYQTKTWVLDVSIAINSAIGQRNTLLAASDWTQLPDVPLATKDAWATYRQALRDITAQPGYPLNIIWPDRPQ